MEKEIETVVIWTSYAWHAVKKYVKIIIWEKMSFQRKVMLIFLFLFFLQNGLCSILKTEERRFLRDLTMFTENRPKPVYSGYGTDNQEQANSEGREASNLRHLRYLI
jgi:hypothetical protein